MTLESRKPRSGALDVLLGSRVKRLRRELGMSQSVLAEKLGITFQQVQKYENGTNRISALMLIKLAASLNVSVGDLLPGRLRSVLPRRRRRDPVRIGRGRLDLRRLGRRLLGHRPVRADDERKPQRQRHLRRRATGAATDLRRRPGDDRRRGGWAG